MHQEATQLYTNFNVEFSTKPRVPRLQGIPVDTRHILFKALAAGLPDEMSPVCPSALVDVQAFLRFQRLDPVTGCYDHGRAMESAHQLADVANGHRRDLLIRAHSRANAAARALARLAHAEPGATAIPRTYQLAATRVPDDHINGFLDATLTENDAVRTIVLLLVAVRAGRQRHAWGGNPHPVAFAPLEGQEEWTPWTPRAFAYSAQQAQDCLNERMRDDRLDPTRQYP